MSPTLDIQPSNWKDTKQSMQTVGDAKGSSILKKREGRWKEPAIFCSELSSGICGAKEPRDQTVDKSQDVSQCDHKLAHQKSNREV